MDDFIKKLPICSEVELTSLEPTRRTATVYTVFGSQECSIDDFSIDDNKTVIVVEDVDSQWADALTAALKVEPEFFTRHCQDTVATWISVMGCTKTQVIKDRRRCHTTCSSVWHIDGIFDSKVKRSGRHSSSTDYGCNLSTRISYWHKGNVILILHDASAGRLHLPVSINRGGLVIEELHQAVQSFLRHQWHFNALFEAISPATFCYMLAASTSLTSLRTIDSDAKRIGFHEIRLPTIVTNTRLHDLRQDLDTLRKEVHRTLHWMPQEVEMQLRAIDDTNKHIGSPKKTLEEILVEIKLLEEFIIDSFTLLLSTISIQQAELSARTSNRAQQLTTLAFIYVPLTFVTGIFGMNISEINASITPAWMVVVTLFVILTFTALLFGGAYLWRHRRDRIEMV